MNVENPIDELFRRKLGQSEAAVPDDMWSRIATARQPEEAAQRTYRPYWLWGGLALTSFLVLGLWFAFRPGTPQVTIGAFPLELTPTQRATSPTASLTDSPSVMTSVGRTESETTAAPEANSKHQLATRSVDQAVVTPRAELTASTVAKAEAVISNPPTAAEIAKPASLSTPAKLTTDEGGALLAVNEEAETEPPTLLENESAATTPLAGEVETESEPIFGPHRRRQNVVVNTIPTENFQQEPEDLSRYLLFANHAPQCARFARNFLRFDLDVLGGPAYAHQLLEAKSSESLNHLDRRTASETAAISYSGGVRLSAISRSGLGVRMGLNYNQINEHFNYPSMKVNFVEGPNGEYVPVDTLYQTMKVDNQLKMVEIPLLVTYETKWKQLRVGFNLGAALNLWLDAEGELYAPTTDRPIAYGQVGDRDVLPLFETQASAALLGSMTVAYNVHRRWSILAEPYFRAHPRAFSNAAYDLTQNYWQSGVQLGLRMRL